MNYNVKYEIFSINDLKLDSGEFFVMDHFTDPYECVYKDYCKELDELGWFIQGMKIKIVIGGKTRTYKVTSEQFTITKYNAERIDILDDKKMLEIVDDIKNKFMGIEDVKHVKSNIIKVFTEEKDDGSFKKELQEYLPDVNFIMMFKRT
jgi:Mg2+ and Co2+ transporter CorA